MEGIDTKEPQEEHTRRDTDTRTTPLTDSQNETEL